MKITKYNILLVQLILLSFFISCGDDEVTQEPEMTLQQKAAKALKDGSPWKVAEVVSKPTDNIDTAPLQNLQISFGINGTSTEIVPGNISASGADQFLSIGSGATWSWSGTGISTIEITDSSTDQFTNIQLSPSAEQATQITLSFQVASNNGRSKDLTGNYTIKMQ